MRREPTHRRPIPKAAIKIDLPNTTQTESYTCGASALLSVCAYFGVGPDHEEALRADMKLTRAGADPSQIVSAAKKYGLRAVVTRDMSDRELAEHLDHGRPVILMLQAWARPRPRSYARRWDDGHWVVAIGYDAEVFYFEDPVIHTSRGFISRSELGARWHDIEGRARTHVERLGIALSRDGVRSSKYARTARRID